MMTEPLRAQLEREAGRTRRALERTPEGRDDWKPHEKSMPLGRLAMLVARMPSWLAISQIVTLPGSGHQSAVPMRSRRRRAFRARTREHHRRAFDCSCGSEELPCCATPS